MPQLNPEFFLSQLFWLAVFFSFLFVFLWRVSLPRIANVLEKRRNKIDENLLSAKELQEQAKEIEKRINEKINQAKQDTSETIKQTLSALNDETSSQLNELEKDLEKKISESEKEILKNRDNQLENINSEIINITKITVSKLANIKLSDDEINQLIKSHHGNLN